jgi:trigger factor
LLKLTDFPVPGSMLEKHASMLLADMQGKFERQGKDLASLGKTEMQLREELKPEAEIRARSEIFLLAVARQKGLEVSEDEVNLQLRRAAVQSGKDYSTVKDYYEQNNLLFVLRDRLLADKGMDEIFSKADVIMAPPKKQNQQKEEGETPKAAASDAEAGEGATGKPKKKG